MTSPLPPDPYDALGVSKDATSAQIKTTYRKLALKCHPDKVTDESQKALAADQFHRIQCAYEIVGDEDKRSRYDAQVKLAELRREVLERQGPRVEVRPAAYDTPTNSPRPTAFAARGPQTVYEERRPSRAYEPDYFDDRGLRTSARKHEEYERAARRTSPQDDRDRIRLQRRETKENERSNRSDIRRAREKDTRRERESKYMYVNEDSSDSEVSYISTSRRVVREEALERAREKYEPVRRQRDPAAEYYDERTKKISSQEDTARDYMQRAKSGPDVEARPVAMRTSSARESYFIRQDPERPAVMARRSSARPRTSVRESQSPRRSSARDRDRRESIPEIPELSENREKRPPVLQSTNSSPATLRGMTRDRIPPMRTQTVQAEYDHPDYPRPPIVRRSETMPCRKDGVQSSTRLRQTEVNDYGMPTPGATPEYSGENTRPAPVSTKYKYSMIEDDVEIANGRRTILREPSDSRKARSPPPMARPVPTPRASSARFSIVQPQPLPRTTSTYHYPPEEVFEVPSPSLRATPRISSERQNSERSKLLYGELGGKRYDDGAKARYAPDEVAYGKRYTSEDVRYDNRRRGSDFRPSLKRVSTTA
ncbi:hypothetical protein LTR66_014003 [Elasticomyces elasticus]|nr:hypothetical protein LTR66_014003 [Elasticomyces elasticus]